jgi:hypothetical protein
VTMGTNCTSAAMMKPDCATSFFAVALLSATFSVLLARAGSPNEPTAATSRGFCPAYFNASALPLRLRLFPLDGPEIDVPAPSGVPRGMNVLAYGPDGRTIYGYSILSPLKPPHGVEKIEFGLSRVSIVPGSAERELREIYCLSASPTSGRLTVTGPPASSPRTFEINSVAGTITQMPADSPSTCGGPGGLLSPDGKRVLAKRGKALTITDVQSGEVRVIEGTKNDAGYLWSPNSKMLALGRGNGIMLVDLRENFEDSPLRKLGSSGDSDVVWSPDSKYLLIRTSSLSCKFTLYGESLEVVEVATGKRIPVKSSHCEIMAGAFGWMDRAIAP